MLYNILSIIFILYIRELIVLQMKIWTTFMITKTTAIYRYLFVTPSPQPKRLPPPKAPPSRVHPNPETPPKGILPSYLKKDRLKMETLTLVCFVLSATTNFNLSIIHFEIF